MRSTRRNVDKWIGKPIIFAEFRDPCNATDIRRWVQAKMFLKATAEVEMPH